MQRSDRHLMQYDVRINRSYSPVYLLGRGDRYDSSPCPPVNVQVSADFDTEQSATAFEARVRELLEML